jgi:TolB protein
MSGRRSRPTHLLRSMLVACCFTVAGAALFAAAGTPGGQAQAGPVSHAGFPVWSPDGRRIAFSSDRHGSAQIWVMNADGSGQRALTRLPSGSAFPAWSADGRWIAFVRASRKSAGVWLHVMRADGSAQRRVSRVDLFGWGYNPPAWSPEGDKLAFTKSSPASLGSHAGIYVVTAEGGDRRLTPPTDFDYHGTSWSPDGRRIAFVLSDGRRSWISVMNADGTQRRKLTKSLRRPIDSLQWSPAGRRIAFVSAGIHVADSDGRHQLLLTRQTPSASSRPDWSPDGRRIVFAREGPPYTIGGDRIYSINADGSGLRLLARSAGGVDSPAWSPDGRRIVFVLKGLAENIDIYVMDADGSHRRRLT